MGLITNLLLSLAVALVAAKVYRTIWFLKIGMTIFEHQPGPCHVFTGVEGSEDMALLPNGQVLISSGLRFRTEEFPKRKGKILLFDFKKPNTTEELKLVWNTDNTLLGDKFNPHGIDALTKDGSTYVFVVNHDPHEAIERFSLDLKKKTLTHLESITDPAMREMNSVVAMDERSFFFTNFAYFLFNERPILNKIEALCQLKFGSIASYDGKTSRGTILQGGFYLPNGLALSRDKNKLYLADIGNLAVQTFDIHSISNITLSHTLDIDTAIDNIQVDPTDGSLWLGCQPSIWQSMHHLEHPQDVLAASHVLTVKTAADGNPTDDIFEVYRNEGKEISVASVALHYQQKTLIGSVDHNMVLCEIRNM